MWNNRIFSLLLFVLVFNLVNSQVQFRVLRQWRYFNFTWPTSEEYKSSVTKGLYIPENIVAAGIMYYKDWIYVTIPRMKTGVPATLGRFTALKGGSSAPLIAPYPSWEFNELGNCSALQNVQNVEVDLNGKIWIIDGGHTGSLTSSPMRTCLPKLIVFDIETNLVDKMYIFPESVVGKDSFLYDLVLDDDFVYITDNSGHNPGIVVYSVQENRSWKIKSSKTMRGETLSSFIINDVPVATPINVAGIALSPKIKGQVERTIYYTPLSSLHVYSISNLILRDEKSSNNSADFDGTITDVGHKISPTDGMIMSNKGALYYGLLSNNSIARWDTRTSFDVQSNQKVLTRDPQYIQWTNSFAFDDKGNLIVLTDTLQKFIYGTLNIKQRNFWLLSAFTGEKSYLSDYEKPLDAVESETTTKEPMSTSTQKKNEESNIIRFTKASTIRTTGKPTEATIQKDTKDDKSASIKNRQIDVVYVIILTIVINLYHKY